MKFDEILRRLDAEVVHRGAAFETAELENVAASDLMSDVLVTDAPRLLIVTSLASDQTIRTADIVGALGVAVVNGKTLPENMRRLARDLNVTLLRSPLSKFEACVALRALSLRPAHV
ncbi:MAG: hypothetical protein U1E27_05740 [Kiritimatiellia bacterium]|nr:hypothetical protein [Kiritimatiellia bacterium]